MEKILNPRSIAVIGASDKKNKIGNILIKNLKNKKYTGLIIPINPRHKIIEGLKVNASILEVKKKVDLAIIAIPASMVLLAVDECIEKKIRNIVIISAGFSESGEDGQKREAELKKVAEANNLNIMGPNCLGFINTNKNINASFAKKEIPKGDIGLISQSGAFVTGLLDIAREEELGFSKIITLGNKVILDEIDSLKYLAKDPKTKIIGLYLENIKRGRLFYNTVASITKKKPILILKAGNSKKVQKAIMSHTGSMAGEIDVFKKAFQDAGVLYFEDIGNFWNTLRLLNNHKPFRNNNLVVLTNAGGPGVIITDLIEQRKNLNFYNFTNKEKESIKKKLPQAASVENPIDILGDADSERYKNSLKEINKIKKIGAVVALITPQAQTDVENILEIIRKEEDSGISPIIPILIGASRKNVFQFPQEVVEALEKLSEYQELQTRIKKMKKEPLKLNVLSSAKIRNMVDKAKEEKREIFFYDESLVLMKYYGIKALKASLVEKDFKISSIPGQLIMKVDDPSILHKMAEGGVKTGIRSRVEFDKYLKQFQRKFKNKKIIVQEQVEKGTEIIIGLKKDPNFGPILLCGMGGILTEIFNEKLLWILPVDKKEIVRDLKNSKISQIFEKEGLDFNSLVKQIEKVAKIGWQNAWLKELDINPMFFYQNGEEPLAVDIKVKIDSKI